MNPLQELLYSIRLITWDVAGKALFASFERARLDRRHATPAESPPYPSAGAITRVELEGNVLRVNHARGEQTLRFLRDGLVARTWNGDSLEPSYAVVEQDFVPAPVELVPTNDGWRAASGEITLDILRSGELRWCRAGAWVQTDRPLLAGARAWELHSDLPEDAVVHGLGQRAFGLDLRPARGEAPRRYRLWNTEPKGHYDAGANALYVSMPVFIQRSLGGCALSFFDDTFDGHVTLGEEVTTHFVDGPKRSWLAFGELSHVVGVLAQLTGHAPLPPRFALGFHQAKWGYDTDEKLRDVLAGYREHDLPLSTLYLDYDYTDGWRTFTPDMTRHPALAETIRAANDAGVEVVASTNPGLKVDPEWDLYQEAKREKVLCLRPDRDEPMTNVVWPGWTQHVDFTSTRARSWWGRQYPRMQQYGVRGFWHDMNEPSGFHAFGDSNPPVSMRHDFEGRGGDHREAHNVYGLLMNRAGFEALEARDPELRPFILSRSGWVGMQRYGWHWTGDVASSWSALRQTIAQVLGLGLCGMPYSGPDIGGFSGHPSPELYTRWFQLGAFLPFFRVHCAVVNPHREPWRFGEEVLDICRRFLRLRYRLLPYWYTLAWQAHRTGAPLVRPLGWEADAPPGLWAVDDAFRLGDALLVAPIVREGEVARSVDLPPGTWFEFESDARHRNRADLHLPLDRVGLLVRAGTILPLEEDGEIVLHLYRPDPGDEGSGECFSDAGDGFGEGRVDAWRLAPSSNGFELQWSVEGSTGETARTVRVRLFGFAAGEVRDRDALVIDGQWITA